MLKIIKTSITLCSFLLLFGCSKDDVDNTYFSPPKSIQDIWISAGKSESRLVITNNNLIENYAENEFTYGYQPLDFNKEFGNGEYIIEEFFDDFSYEIIITRKDGNTLKDNPTLKRLRRKYVIGRYNNNEVLLLNQTGLYNAYLVRE
jgi:hypothetical protein